MTNPVAAAIPAFEWLRGYRRDWLVPDLVAGVSAGAVVLPQAMAYASIANLPVEVGLYTCMVPMVVYALLGGSRVLSVSTTSTIATLSATTLVAAGVAASSADPYGGITTLTLLVGIVLLVARVLRLGTLVDTISDSVLTGIKAGVGLTVAAGQLPKLLGVPANPDADHFFAELADAVRHLSDASAVTIALSVGTIATLLLVGRFAPRVPAPLIAVAGGILLVAFGNLDEHGVSLIAKVPSGVPTLDIPPLDGVGALLPGAIAIGLMAFIETVSVARGMRRPDEPPIDNDRELVAAGLASVAGAYFRAMPAAGGFSQTAVNESSGARTQLSELTTAGLAVLVALFLAPVLDNLPEATLGAMVVVATLGLVKPREFVALFHFSRLEFCVAAGTAAVSLVGGLLTGVAVGVAVTFVLVLHELNHPEVVEVRASPVGGFVPASPALDAVPGLLVLRLGAPLYTANARAAQRRVLEHVDGAEPRPSLLVLDAASVGLVSTTVLGVLHELQRELDDREVTWRIAALPDRALAMARRSPDWDEWLGTLVRPTVAQAVAEFERS